MYRPLSNHTHYASVIQRLNKDNPVLRNLGLTKGASWRWNSLPQCMHHLKCNTRVQHVTCKQKRLRTPDVYLGFKRRTAEGGGDYSKFPRSLLRAAAASRAEKTMRGMIIQRPLVFCSGRRRRCGGRRRRRQSLCCFTRSRSVHQHTTNWGRAWD